MTFKTVPGGSFDRIRDGCGQKDQQTGPTCKKKTSSEWYRFCVECPSKDRTVA